MMPFDFGPTPSTASSEYAKDLKFGHNVSYVMNTWAIEAILEFPTLSRDMGGKPPLNPLSPESVFHP